MDAEAVVLRAAGLSHRLGGRQVVEDVDVALRPAEVVGVLGPNGAGKTTLLRLLSGSLRGQRGRVWLGEAEVTGLPLWRRARLGIGYLPQGPSVFGGLRVRENVEAVVQVRRRKLPRRDRAKRAMGLLALMGLEQRAHQRASTLSGGERRRLELARLLALEPRVALLDEPFAGLDAGAAAALGEQIGQLAARGIAVAIADHRLQQALAICRRACILVAGRQVLSGSAAEITQRGVFQQALLGRLDPDVGAALGGENGT
jgi:lipopolysaccharide export system ATP-binding protein